MGSTFSGGENEANNSFKTGGENDLSQGPCKNRSCTDIVFLPIFVFAQFVWVVVTIIGISSGNPSKLYQPRDYSGAYCGVETNWNDGPDLVDQVKLTYTMNISSTADIIVKQMMCSSGVASVMQDILPDQAAVDEYLCACCISPCARCEGAYDVGGDLSDAASIGETITARMQELTDPEKAKDLFSPSGANADTFSTSSFWTEAMKYFNPVCLPECQMTAGEGDDARTFSYRPAPDTEFYSYWMTLENNSGIASVDAILSTLTSAFQFQALSFAQCPYEPLMCVPFPGLEMKELGSAGNYCTFAMAAEAAAAISSVAADALTSIGLDSISAAGEESFGKMFGDIAESIDTFIIVSILSFAIGVAFLVLLRFFIGACVWLAVLTTILFFVFSGYLLFVVSGQCEGASIFETGHQAAVAITLAASTAASDAVQGNDDVPSEAMTGDGADYRGRQHYSRYGKKCLTWESQEIFSKYRAANYTVLSPADSTKNYCRNPYLEEDANKAKTIWCVTTDPDVPWEECIPVGVIQPECQNGYAVADETARDVLFYSCFVVWGLGVIWTICVICMVGRIRLAIALNKVGAKYLATNPSTLLIPVCQAIVAIVWCIIWIFGATFLLSQVPDSYTPMDSYATYAEAYGTSDVAGKCTDSWPTGSVYKDPACAAPVDGEEAKCWRCHPPRYVFDVRFAISFFVFLWNNAFNVALGQMLVAMAVSLWFFSTDKMTTFVVKPAVKTVFRYHVGTVAFGSFIVAVVQFIRYLMKYFEKQAAAQKNRIMVFVLKVVQCCIWCFEKCIKFLNKNAYIQTALMGTNFCTSAKKAFYLILRNALRFGTMAVLGSVIYSIGLVSIMAGTGCIGYLLMRAMHSEISPFMPVLIFLILAWVVAKIFMNVFGLAVDTCLQCFLATEEMGAGQEFVPSELDNFIKNSENKLGDPDANPPNGK